MVHIPMQDGSTEFTTNQPVSMFSRCFFERCFNFSYICSNSSFSTMAGLVSAKRIISSSSLCLREIIFSVYIPRQDFVVDTGSYVLFICQHIMTNFDMGHISFRKKLIITLQSRIVSSSFEVMLIITHPLTRIS